MQGENYIILATMLRKLSYFVKNVFSRSSGMEPWRSPAKIFISSTEILVLAASRYMNTVNQAWLSSGYFASPLFNFFVKLFMCSFEKSSWPSYRDLGFCGRLCRFDISLH